MRDYFYFNNCVNWNSADVDAEGGLCDMISSGIDISRKTFLKHVDKSSFAMLEQDLGYERFARRGLTIANDLAVRYYKGKLHGETVYWLNHSAIEYVFISKILERKLDVLHSV
jgi:hypothetical protein